MVLEGVVTNVAAFGAFVDVGVHQDGLVHVSAMSRTFVSDPHTVVKSGDVVRVKVLSVDIPRHRISLTLRLDDDAGQGADQAPGRARAEGRAAPDAGRAGRGSGPRPAGGGGGGRGGRPGGGNRGGARDAAPDGALADALRRAGLVPKPPRDR
jgi:uncharacterized protein